ncbi:MAG: penicillin-binding protein 2 [Selenomonadaceae bacterium]|nr:penicillin-binding protein 2 [Selenomonadaceae bacterium]
MTENTGEFSKRLTALGGIIVLVIAVLIGRMGYLQVYEGEHYASLADGNRIRLVPAVAARGTFYDRNGNMLVTNRPGFTVALLPLTEPISPDVIERLSKLLNVPVEEINRRIENHMGFDPIRIKNDVGPDLLTIIEEQKELYPGVVVEVQPIRQYIFKEMAVHALGYVSEISDTELEDKKDQGYKTGDIIGKFGLEKMYDQLLRGIDGGEQVEVDVTGKPVQILGKKNPVPGHDVVLTIDRDIQLATEKAVDDQLKLIGASAAAAVVMNPQTGEILAIVSRPGFDPNLFAQGISEKEWKKINENPFYPMDNKAITGEYPPGSTFKIVTGTAALAAGKVTPEEKILDTGHHWIIPKGNAEGEALGWINFDEAMAHSDNVYFYEMGNRLGIDELEKYARMFGLGEKTGVNLPYEAEGLVANRRYKEKFFEEDWYLAETFDAAIGQGFNLVTPIQAAMVMAEIAADGKRYQPYLVQKIMSHDGKLVKKFEPVLLGQLQVSQDIISLVQHGLKGVTKYGTAAFIFGKDFPIDIAGKTGTAENPHGKDHGWFVAYGPFDNPSVVVAVIVEQGGFGAQSAVPIGKKILEAVFHIPTPEQIAAQKKAAEQAKLEEQAKAEAAKKDKASRKDAEAKR